MINIKNPYTENSIFIKGYVENDKAACIYYIEINKSNIEEGNK